MSNMSNVHYFTKFDAKTSRALQNQRLSKVVFKKGKNVQVKKQSMCVSIPHIQIGSESYNLIADHILELVKSAQDGIIRVAVENGKDSIADSDIGIMQVKSYLDSVAEGERLQKTDVEEWFDSSVSEMLQVALADKMGISDTPSEVETIKLAGTIKTYKEKFAAMAGGRTIYSSDDAKKLIKVLEVVGCSDEIASKFVVRLNKMQVSELQHLEALG